MMNHDYSIKISSSIRTKIMTLCVEATPGLASIASCELFEDRGRVFAFLVTKVVWHKLRIFRVNWVRISANSFSKIQLADVLPLQPTSLQLAETIDMLSLERSKTLIAEWKQKFQQEPLKQQATCSEVYTQRFLTYGDHLNTIKATFPNQPSPTIHMNRVIKHDGMQAYHLYLEGVLHDRTYYLRFVEIKGKCRLHIDTCMEEDTILNKWEWLQEHDLEKWEDVADSVEIFKREEHVHTTLMRSLLNNSFKSEGAYFNNEINVLVSEWTHPTGLKFKMEVFDGSTTVTASGFDDEPLKRNICCTGDLMAARIELQNLIQQAMHLIQPNNFLFKTRPVLIPPTNQMHFADRLEQIREI